MLNIFVQLCMYAVFVGANMANESVYMYVVVTGEFIALSVMIL